MANRIRILEDRWFVSDIVNDFKPPTEDGPERDICIPTCQREWAWKNARGLKKMQSLIDSVMNGYPIPTCILNRTNLRKYEIYDGRHRIETLYRYANDRFEWNGKLYSTLTHDEKAHFENRQIPVTIMIEATKSQLSDVFIRLNKGVALKDYDIFWANRHTSLVSSVERLVFPHARLSHSLGDVDLRARTDLANWVALVHGLNTREAGNITTSHIRVFDNDAQNNPVDDAFVTLGLDALATLYERANEQFPCTNTEKRRYKKVGKITAFFIADWMSALDKENAINKWVDIIGRIRRNDSDMLRALTTTGAQNLTSGKIAQVLRQVNNWIDNGIRADTGSDDGDDDDE